MYEDYLDQAHYLLEEHLKRKPRKPLFFGKKQYKYYLYYFNLYLCFLTDNLNYLENNKSLIMCLLNTVNQLKVEDSNYIFFTFNPCNAQVSVQILKFEIKSYLRKHQKDTM